MEFNKNLGKQDMNSDGQYHTILSGTQGEENVKSISEEMRQLWAHLVSLVLNQLNVSDEQTLQFPNRVHCHPSMRKCFFTLMSEETKDMQENFKAFHKR